MALMRQKVRVKQIIHLLVFPGLFLSRVRNPALETLQTDLPQPEVQIMKILTEYKS